MVQGTNKGNMIMIKRDKLGRFVSTKRVLANKKAVAVKSAKSTKATAKKVAAKKTTKKVSKKAK